MHITAHRLLIIGLLCLGIAAAAYAALQLTHGPQPIFVHVRWAPDVSDTARQEAERRYSLSQAEPLEGRTWGYTLSDLSAANVKALVSDAAVEDTQDIDRAAFRASPTAEKRPYPPSDSLIPASLWAVTVLCLFVGFTGASLGLIERAVAGTAEARIAPPPAAAQRLTVTQALSLLFILALMAICFVVARTMELRVDEANHLGQIQRYLAGNFVTTSTASGGFHATAAIFAWRPGSREGRASDCSSAGVGSDHSDVPIAREIGRAAGQHGADTPVRTLSSPVSFWFLIYTDVLALLLLLLAVLALTRIVFT